MVFDGQSMRCTVLFISTLCTAWSATITFNDQAQGSEVTQCVKISDWHTKMLTEAVEVAPREANGCCPSGFTYGSKAYSGTSTGYTQGMIVCGYQADGTVGSISTATNCNYGKCYLVKQGGAVCQDGTAMKLNTCCSTDGTQTNFPTAAGTCTWKTSVSSGSGGNAWKTCRSYKTKPGTASSWTTIGTASAADDVVSNVLQVDKVRHYGWCGLSPGDGTAPGAPAPSPASFARGLMSPILGLWILSITAILAL
jgi:hypothetical protein